MNKYKNIELNLDKTYEVLNALKVYKHLTTDDLVEKCDMNKNYILLSIQYLQEQGYFIEVVKGVNGGYIYHGDMGNKKPLERVSKNMKTGIIKLYNKNIPIAAITNLTGKKKECIYDYLKKAEVKPNRKGIKPEYKKVKYLYDSGLSVKEISKELNISYNYASKLVYSYIKGTRRNKVDREKVKKYIMENPNMTGKEIAKVFGVSEGTISIIKKNI